MEAVSPPAWHALAAGASSAVVSRLFTCEPPPPLLPCCQSEQLQQPAFVLPPIAGMRATAILSVDQQQQQHLQSSLRRCHVDRTAGRFPPSPADPPDTVKARLQVQGAGGAGVLYRGTLDAFAKIAAGEVRAEAAPLPGWHSASSCFRATAARSKEGGRAALPGARDCACMPPSAAAPRRLATHGTHGPVPTTTGPAGAP